MDMTVLRREEHYIRRKAGDGNESTGEKGERNQNQNQNQNNVYLVCRYRYNVKVI